MRSYRSYTRFTWIALVMVFLVVIAGGTVRMTQSGMGCPDWPKCFGSWIPPTQASQLPADFEKYLKKQDIDHTFNAFHTWTEYINRLVGALLGIVVFIHFLWSFRLFRKTNRSIVLLSFLLLLGVGFEAWLGKTVVDHNLAVVKITTHMLMALVLAGIPLLIIRRLQQNTLYSNKLLAHLSVSLLIILLVQIVLGTQVREQVDEISKSMNYGGRETWISQLDFVFLIHRSFSWVVLIGSILLAWKSAQEPALKKNGILILLLAISAMTLGIILAYLQVPAIAQPLHLLMGMLLAVAVFGYRLRLR